MVPLAQCVLEIGMDKVLVVIILIEVLQMFCNSFLGEISDILEGLCDVVEAKGLKNIVQCRALLKNCFPR